MLVSKEPPRAHKYAKIYPPTKTAIEQSNTTRFVDAILKGSLIG